jgi:hypothetical protein
MDAQAIAVVSGSVVALTQLVKWMGLDDRRGPFAVLALSGLGTIIWAISREVPFVRTELFTFFTGWIMVSLAAAGVFGFTRAMPEAVTRTKTPPLGGAGSSPTI